MEVNTSSFESSECGWAGSFPVLRGASANELVNALVAFARDSTPEQIRAWNSSIPLVQVEAGKVLDVQPLARDYSAVLEYGLPYTQKRADVILLIAGAVLVVELKGDGHNGQAYLEQVADYARGLYTNHILCGPEGIRVHALVVNYGMPGAERRDDWITVTNVDKLHAEVLRFDQPGTQLPIPLAKFLDHYNHQPAPSLVQAVRAYFTKQALPRIKRIDEVTGAALAAVIDEIRATHRQQRRKLILVSGVPGAGKTYVGLQIAHEHFLDDLSETLPNGEKPTAPAVFLSGNKPLVDVLQYEMRRAGGEGKVFVQNVKDFVKRYTRRKSVAPPHHVVIFDEAQRAWDAHRVQIKHDDPTALSEPAAFIQFARRIPSWSVVIGLIGEGQQIYTGEEGGMELWADAVKQGGAEWDVCGPAHFAQIFEERNIPYQTIEPLHLAKSVRFHFASGLSEWASSLIDGTRTHEELQKLADVLWSQGYQIRLTRDLHRAKEFLWEKYRDQPDARYGLLTGGRDKGLNELDIHKVKTFSFHAGPWYADPESSPSSCRRLTDAISEFSAQGLELDHSLLVWGTDLIRKGYKWDDSLAMRYQKRGDVEDPLRLRLNAYRVLLTRGREGVLICVPRSIPELDETYEFLLNAGCRLLE
ncbi:MAG: DUF2075 domain-containing protein [Flavobacteriales bacterium]|jgi:hypothetical protein|nr:DUF2075 domain-containing protein [Flavobacteriales bacterium]